MEQASGGAAGTGTGDVASSSGEPCPPSISSGMPDEKEGMEQVQSDLQVLKRLYGLVHKGPADDNLDEKSRAYLVRILNDATQKALKRQGEKISGSPMHPALERNLSVRSDRWIRAAEPSQSLNPPTSPSLSLHNVRERLHRLNLRHSPSLSSRDGRVHGHRQEPIMSRLTSNRSSATAMPPRPYTSQEQQSSVVSRGRLNLHQSTSSSRDGRHANNHHRHAVKQPHALSRILSNRSSRPTMPQRHRPSLQHLNSGLSLNRFLVSATYSQHGAVKGRSPGGDLRDGTLPPVYDRSDRSSLERRSLQRSVSRKLSLGREQRPQDHATARRTGAEGSSTTARRFRRLGSGLSVGTVSRHGSERVKRSVALPRMCRENNAVSSVGCSNSRPRRMLSRIYSGDTYNISSSSDAVSSFTYTSPTVSSASSVSASSYSYSSPVPRRGRARLTYTSDSSDSSRNRHHQQQRKERKERREEGLRRLTKKIGMVFHHRHDHHHKQQQQPGGQEASSPRSDHCELNRKDKSPWKHLGGMFHRKKGKNKKKAPASFKLKKMASSVLVKKKHWWQLKKRHRKERRRFGH